MARGGERRGWLTRSGIRLEPQHDIVENDGTPGRVVVEELVRWTAETGERRVTGIALSEELH